jgi:hypothetical protein
VNDSIHVECYSGYTYAQEPRTFEWRGQRYQVKRVVKRWRTPSGPGFRVEVAGVGRFDLVYLEFEDKWTLAIENSFKEDQR